MSARLLEDDRWRDAAREMQPRVAMMKTVKHTIYSIGDASSDFARMVGSEGADLARRFGSNTADLATRFGSNTADLALQLNKRGRKLAKQIGPKRGLIGLAVLAAAIGGTVVLVRYLRARAADAELENEDLESNGDTRTRSNKRGKSTRAEASA